MSAKENIAAFLDTGETLMLARKHQQHLFGIVSEGSCLERYARTAWAGRILSIKTTSSKKNAVTFEETIHHTNLTRELHRYGVSAVLLPARSSDTIVRWSRKQRIRILGPSLAAQRKLEDKIVFDTLLRKEEIPAPARITHKTRDRHYGQTTVVQKRNSMGGEGTSYQRVSHTTPTRTSLSRSLARTYLRGIPVGVSVFLDRDGNYFFSALRRQCFTRYQGFPHHFLGVQWIKTIQISPSLAKTIEKILIRLVTLLQGVEFIGVANIDMILTKDSAWVLECNPRFSTATPHVFSVPSLTSHPDPWTFLMRAFLGIKNMTLQCSALPKSTFSGSIASIDVYERTQITSTPPVGSFADAFLLHDVERGQTLSPHDTVCTLYSKNPFFTSRGAWNVRGSHLARSAIRTFFS